jgi:GDPmannose 4,6-dehydratase
MKALILGVNGQDGTFLARHLLAGGTEVVGIGRQPAPIAGRFGAAVRYLSLDLRDAVALAAALDAEKPDRIFHMAAVHASAGGKYEPIFREMLQVNVASVHVVLEYMRMSSARPRLLYASSAKVFGEPLPEVIDELTPRVSTCLYSVTKNAARDTIDFYRRQHGVRAGVVYLFNHESELRPSSFFIAKLVAGLVAARRGTGAPTRFNTLRFHCDWGSAEEYMSILLDVIDRAPGEDFVLGTGRSTDAAKLVRELFTLHDLDPQLVEEQSCDERQRAYSVDTAKLASRVGRVPSLTIRDVVARMLERERFPPSRRG